MGLMSYFGDIKGKLRIFIFLAADGDLAAVSLHHLVHIVQSESEARDTTLAVLFVNSCPAELVKDDMLVFL